ncbi:MAG: hypothetical protein B7Y59_12765 [Burkholderiales bacterium 35-55-47]|jgi:hypothetical protein|nr:MAG: hypothetical protein B7Y59_12765 [Burkholderiales bacterium 35-55-47]OYZ71924.1 MAG: hypothetical protein B7Y06_12925 [Burkholderiales bacterium 24-55-52]OZA98888.1 MAG: hypothetical protein B7X62_12755 [Burkholderiales bacterium 39-55-53]
MGRQMIKITVNSAVYEALQKAFPKPANAAHRALNKYVTTLENMIFKSLHFQATPMQSKLDLFAISLQQLANRGGQIGPKKVRLHAWLRDNNLSLIEPVIVGSNLTGELSQCKLTSLVTLVDTLEVEEEILKSAKLDRELDAYLCGDDFGNVQVLNLLYPEFKSRISRGEIEQLFDFLPVDVESLKSYIVWLVSEAEFLSSAQKEQALRQARIILAVASVLDGHFVQRKKPSDFGRMYYEGVSVQSINKELRRAVLGNCWEYDVKSSVVAWKMGWAKQYIDSRGRGEDLRKVFSATLNFLEDKAEFMEWVQQATFEDDSLVPPALQPKLLKQAFTAISFGARQNAHGWQNESGGWTNPALVDIIKNSRDRERFLADPTVKFYIEEQGILDAHLYERVKAERRDLLSKTYLQTASGRPSRSKILAYLYQHDETEIMNVVCAVAAKYDREPLARVHDAVFFKRKLSLDIRHEMELCMREHSNNPYWRLGHKQLQRYDPRHLDQLADEAAHRLRIQQEEAHALGYKSPFWN